MAKIKTNQVYIIAGVVAAAIVAYFGGKYIKKLKNEKAAALLAAQQLLVVPVAPVVDPSAVIPPVGTISNPFVNKAELVAFQKWVFDVKKDTSLATPKFPNGQDGSWGKLSATAWTKYGKEYLTSKETGDVSTKPSDKDIDFIIKYSKGTGANLQRSNLEKKPIQYIKNWVAALNVRMNSMGSGGTTFIYDKKVFNTYDGEKISDVDFYNKEVKTKATSYGFLKPDRYSGSVKYLSNVELGTVKSMLWNNDQKLLFLYVPEKAADYKWTTINQITTN